MTIICNNCVGGRLYQCLGLQYNNPFIWSRIYYDSFRKIISEFNIINFLNIYFDDSYISGDCNNHIILEDTIEINYPHYIQNSKFDVPTIQNNGIDIYYNNIKTYTLNKYLTRYKRLNYKDERKYILVDLPTENLTKDNIIDFFNLKLDGIKVLVTPHTEYKSDTTYVHYTNSTNTKVIAKELINKYPKIFQ